MGLLNASRYYVLNFQWRVQGKDTVLYLLINADKWRFSHEMDYSGFVIIRGIYFLVRGDTAGNRVIRKCTAPGDTIRLQRPVSDDFLYFYKCLQDFEGYYQGCGAGYFYLNMRLESNIKANFRTRPLRLRDGRK